ncbi:essential protein Yae1, N-terminal [Actinidia rufa]|uniref:Essential protein Yae1, N-terminal n=1 Tax=Actinidia rufa TaxID=165716 RepID=A0A7J0EVK7_9ERIC|nr:essential protein Yae1, N-terminal [Actinidia rufa]
MQKSNQPEKPDTQLDLVYLQLQFSFCTSMSHDIDQSFVSDPKLDNLSHDDGSLWGSSPEEQNNLSDLDREWNKRHDQFHTIGYRDGLIAGKEASAQEGFNMGFKESVLVGYNWGLVRGVTSALTFLPDGLREKLIKTQEERQKFQSLYETVHSLFNIGCDEVVS